MQKKRIYFKLLLGIWAVLICGYMVINYFEKKRILALYDVVLYILLSIQLMTINFILVHKVNKIFKDQDKAKFAKEKFFLTVTLLVFSFSYALSTTRSIILYMIFTNGSEAPRLFYTFCKSLDALTALNFACFTITELIPYCTIFILNWRNFRQIKRANSFFKSREDKLNDRIKKYKSNKEAPLEM